MDKYAIRVPSIHAMVVGRLLLRAAWYHVQNVGYARSVELVGDLLVLVHKIEVRATLP